jgi:hypothetical protein
MGNISHTLEVKQVPDSEDLYIDLPPALLEKAGWTTDAELTWSVDSQLGVIYITQKDKG